MLSQIHKKMPIPYSAIFNLIGLDIPPLSKHGLAYWMKVDEQLERTFTPKHLIIYEDDLPDRITNDMYEQWFEKSIIVDGVRMGLPIYHFYKSIKN